MRLFPRKCLDIGGLGPFQHKVMSENPELTYAGSCSAQGFTPVSTEMLGDEGGNSKGPVAPAGKLEITLKQRFTQVSTEGCTKSAE